MKVSASYYFNIPNSIFYYKDDNGVEFKEILKRKSIDDCLHFIFDKNQKYDPSVTDCFGPFYITNKNVKVYTHVLNKWLLELWSDVAKNYKYNCNIDQLENFLMYADKAYKFKYLL